MSEGIKEKNMKKKLIILMAALLLALALAGCGKTDEEPAPLPEETAPAASETPVPEETPEPLPEETPEPEVTPEPEPEYDFEAEEVSLRAPGNGGLLDGSQYYVQTVMADTPVEISAETPFSRLYILWHNMPDEWYLSTDGENYETVENQVFLHQCYDLPEPTDRLFLKVPEDSAICELYAFTDGNYPDWVQQWSLMEGEADILMFPTHSDDEWCFFAGIVPLYAGELGYKVQVVYMTNHVYGDGVYRVHELLNGLWYAGERYYPEINYDAVDRMFDSYYEAQNFYGEENFIGFQVEMIRKYQPLVVVGHDLNGEYGHNTHKLNGRCLPKAVELAADSSEFPESAETYGAWDTQKMYIHMYGENQIFIDGFDEPLDAFDGKTAMEVAVQALKYHVTQIDYSYVRQGGTQDSHLFGLYRTTVGEDVLKNDLLENTSRELYNED